jgi:hypothetical protein
MRNGSFADQSLPFRIICSRLRRSPGNYLAYLVGDLTNRSSVDQFNLRPNLVFLLDDFPSPFAINHTFLYLYRRDT